MLEAKHEAQAKLGALRVERQSLRDYIAQLQATYEQWRGSEAQLPGTSPVEEGPTAALTAATTATVTSAQTAAPTATTALAPTAMETGEAPAADPLHQADAWAFGRTPAGGGHGSATRETQLARASASLPRCAPHVSGPTVALPLGMSPQPISAEPWAGLGPRKQPQVKDVPEPKQ